MPNSCGIELSRGILRIDPSHRERFHAAPAANLSGLHSNTGEGYFSIDVVTDAMWDAVLDSIDEKCKAEDTERRRIAVAEKAAALSPKSKKRH